MSKLYDIIPKGAEDFYDGKTGEIITDYPATLEWRKNNDRKQHVIRNTSETDKTVTDRRGDKTGSSLYGPDVIKTDVNSSAVHEGDKNSG